MLKRNRKRGQSIVEMALLFPLFLLIVIGGMVDFGFAFYNAIALQQVASDTASNCAENDLSNAATNNFIANYSSPPIGWRKPGIYSAKISELRMQDGSRMKRVELEYHSQTYTPFYQAFLNAVAGNNYLTLRTQATYKVPNVIKNR